MKKNLAKKVTLSILAGAMLMSSSVAWADNLMLGGQDAIVATGDGSLAVGKYSIVYGDNSIAIGIGAGSGTYTQVGANDLEADNAIAIGSNAKVTGGNSVAIGVGSKAIGSDSVALGYGSLVGNTVVEPVVSVGRGSGSGDGPATRRIINVTAGVDDNDAVNKAQLDAAIASVQGGNVNLSNYYTKAETDGTFATKDYVDNNFVKIETQKDANNNDVSVLNVIDSSIVVKKDTTTVGVNIDYGGITVGEHSTHMNESGFYACDGGSHDYDGANAAMMKDGRIKGAGGAFTVDASGNVTATNLYNITQVDGALAQKANVADVNAALDLKANVADVNAALDLKANASDVYTKTEADGLLGKKANAADVYTKTEIDSELGKKADQSALEAEKTAREQADQDLQSQIDNIGGGAIAGINQRLDKTNAKINKVGAGAAALAALHPLEYDPDDKLTFSAGMGNYAGENAAALGAFYRPNEKFMVSLGGTMGNGENMVNLGLSIGLDKPNGYAKLSKRELIQEVNAVKAENNMLIQKVDAVEAENEAIKAEMAEMKAMLQAIMAKK